MYYLFLYKKQDLEKFKTCFEQTRKNIEEGKTPVYSELRAAKSGLYESLPYNVLHAIFMVISATIVNRLGDMSDAMNMAVVLVINSVTGVIANYIFTIAKHFLRIRLCRRLGIEPNERNIAVFESLEYQTV